MPVGSRTRRIVLRCDADELIGLGHATRALALGEALAQTFDAPVVIVARPTPLLRRFLEGRDVSLVPVETEGYALEDVLATCSSEDILVSDSYDLGERAMDALTDVVASHVVIDDFARLSRWPCDVVVNPNVNSTMASYATAPIALVGASYALLRREIREAAARAAPPRSKADRLLVCLGGGTAGDTSGLLKALEGLEGEGTSIRMTSDRPIAGGLVEAVAPASLADQLVWADVAILSGGVLKYEAAACGVPAVLVAVVPHQEDVAAAFAELGTATYAGPLNDVSAGVAVDQARALLASAPARQALHDAGRSLVDAQGADRVATAVRDRLERA